MDDHKQAATDAAMDYLRKNPKVVVYDMAIALFEAGRAYERESLSRPKSAGGTSTGRLSEPGKEGGLMPLRDNGVAGSALHDSAASHEYKERELPEASAATEKKQ